MKKRLLMWAVLVTIVSGLSAKVKLPTILADNMVLQQQSDVKLWGGNDAIAKARKSVPIRMYTTQNKYSKTPEDDIEGSWSEHTSEDVANWSATAYFFGRYLQEVLDVPVGLVVSAWGGSKIEAWMSEDAMNSFTEFDLSYLKTEVKPNTPNHHTPCYLYNAKLHPLIPFAIKGFIWYQGESNRDYPELYTRLHPAFVKDIRQKWGIGEFPFYYVQIAPYNYGDSNAAATARLREIQQQGMKDIPNSGMVVTMDIGDEKCIHPARISRCVAPIATELENFEIAGEDRVFHPAKAYVNNGRIVVSSDKVANPVAARYGYKNYVKGTLKDDTGLAVSSFRTDSW